jgi:uncharacterized protein
MATSSRVVIDTNVWISAALSSTGAPAQVIARVLARGLPVFSQATFAELESRLWKPKFDRYLSMDVRRRILHDANAASHWVEIPDPIKAQRYSRDADDDKFIHTALAAQVTWLITGDQDLLALAAPLAAIGVRVVAPAEALARPDFCA